MIIGNPFANDWTHLGTINTTATGSLYLGDLSYSVGIDWASFSFGEATGSTEGLYLGEDRGLQSLALITSHPSSEAAVYYVMQDRRVAAWKIVLPQSEAATPEMSPANLLTFCSVDSGSMSLHNCSDLYTDAGAKGEWDDLHPEFHAKGFFSTNRPLTLSLPLIKDKDAFPVISSCSGYGDGGYPVYVRANSLGELAEVVIVFIDASEEEEV
jgi:hypothetical protein